MLRLSFIFTALAGSTLLVGVATSSGCGDSKGGFVGSSGGSGGSSGSGSGSGGSSGGTSSGSFGTSSSSGGSTAGDAGVQCPAGLACNVSCSGGGTTTVTGKVYDPAGKNPLYNVAVYVPATPLQPLPKGVPTGADACSCAALFKAGALTSTVTSVDGTFTLTNVPVGSKVPLVLQIGKWRRSLQINVTACEANAQPDKSLTLPGTVADGSDDNMPDIAVSTGMSDSLECLMLRIGLPASEYVAGAGTGGHVHVFSGGTPGGLMVTPSGVPNLGAPEERRMPGAPNSYTDLWADQSQLMPYDITLLSCEGGETYNANPAALEAYLSAGGRAFASHYHYTWFTGPLETTQSYKAPDDWGNNLATWTAGTKVDTSPVGGDLVTTLSGSTMPFPKGQAMQEWLTAVGALGQDGVGATQLSIFDPRYNAVVAAPNKPSQPWITSALPTDLGPAQQETMYFSFDTPVNLSPPTGPDPSGTTYCGRAVFSDLHVGSSSGDGTNSGIGVPGSNPPPEGCTSADLSPQEKALEFMLFDLSSCVIPDTIQPPVMVPVAQ